MKPILKEGIMLGTFECNGSEDLHYFVANAKKEAFEIDKELYDILEADIDAPLVFPSERKCIIPELEKAGIIQTKRFMKYEGPINQVILFFVNCTNDRARNLWKYINSNLPWLSFAVFFFGLIAVLFGRQFDEEDTNIVLLVTLLVASILFHELGHMTASMASGTRVGQVGILLFLIIPIGAYYACVENDDMTQKERIQFALAGIEMNIFFSGFFLLCSVLFPALFNTFATAANVNIVLAMVNLLPTNGFDGETALSAMFGVKDIGKIARKWMSDRALRSRLLHSGFKGIFCFVVFLIMFLSKIIYGVLIVYDVITVVSIFLY